MQSYDSAAVNARMAAIPTAAQRAEAEKPTITSGLTDGATYNGKVLSVEVFAKDYQGNKISPTLTLNGTPVESTWDGDTVKTTFTLTLRSGENSVVISATANGQTVTVTYTILYEEAPLSFVLSVDAFTVGAGYLVKPVVVTLDEATLQAMAIHFGMADAASMKEALTGAYVLEYFLAAAGYTTAYTGELGSTYYLSSVGGFDYDRTGASIPENLRNAIGQGNLSEAQQDDPLGEFVFTYMSGWMYTVNGSFANVGMGQYYPQQGDVMRVQFTLYGYGTDIGGDGFGMSEPMFAPVIAERDELSAAMAQARAAGLEESAQYSAAYTLITQFGITAQQLKDATETLLAAINAAQ